MAVLKGNARKIADLFWAGKKNAYAVRVETSAPRCFGQGEAWREATVVDSASRDGHAWKARTVEFFAKNVVPFELLWRSGVEIEVVATESANRANTALENLDVTVRKFHERIKNDLSSMKASSDRVQSEVSQMSEKYKAAQEILTSPVMEKAIANAERLAIALKQISELSETKLSVAVFGPGPANGPESSSSLFQPQSTAFVSSQGS